jgi:hypothetical protein
MMIGMSTRGRRSAVLVLDELAAWEKLMVAHHSTFERERLYL